MAGTVVGGIDLFCQLIEAQPRILELQSALFTLAKVEALVIDGEFDRSQIAERTQHRLGRRERATRDYGILPKIVFSFFFRHQIVIT